jgi:hypothetical protein
MLANEKSSGISQFQRYMTIPPTRRNIPKTPAIPFRTKPVLTDIVFII